MVREHPSRSNPRGTPDGERSRQAAPSRGSRARSTRTPSPPPPNVPQPLVRLVLVVVFIGTAWGIFSQVTKQDHDEGADRESAQAADALPSTESLPPSLRIVGTWRYVLNDDESANRTEAQSSIDAGSDDPISRVMLSRLDLRLRDNLEITQTGLTITRGDKTESGSWEAIEEGDDSLTFVFTSGSRGELRAEATFTGGDWLSLDLVTDAATSPLRWRRIKPALPSELMPPQTRTTETP